MNNTPSHIVFLSPGFAESEKDSTTIPALQVFLRALSEQLTHTKLTLITFQFPHNTKPYYWNNIEVIPLSGNNKRLKKIWIWEKAKKRLELIHKQQKIEVIHSFWIGECSKIGQQFSKKHNIKHIVTVMGQDAILKNRYAKYLINSSAKVVTLSKNHYNDLLQTHRLKSEIIPWQLDTSHFPPLEEIKIDILGVGSLNDVKNYDNFITIVSELIQLKPNVTVSIIGNGYLKQKLKEKTKVLGIQNNITFEGELPRKKVLKKMAQSNILLHTSHYESFGFVFLEALFSGMHIISHNVGLAHSANYWHVCKNNNDIKDALIKKVEQNKRTKTRVELYSDKVTTNAYLNLYNA